MLDNIINKNILFLQNHGVKMNHEDDKAIYKYGLQILYYYIIDLVVIFSLAHCFGRLYETAIMTFIFALFQVFGGGYHAKTPLKCLMTMIIGAVIGNALIMLGTDKPILNIVLTVIISGIIFILTPVTNKRHPVSKKIQSRSKVIVRIIIILVLPTISLLSYYNKNVEAAIIAVTLALYLISLATAKMQR